MAPVAAANAMTKITLSFMLSLLGDKNFQGPDAPVNSKYHWAYKGPEGPDSWHVHYKYCAGERQSPINIMSSSCEYDPSLEPIILENFDATSGSGSCILNVTNNGHAASVRVLNQDMRVRGGGLGQDYKTVEFHFHWGSTDDVGSEHAVNGKKYPLEMHVVNYAAKYGNVKAAMTQPDGLAVLGVFFEITEMDNPYFAAVDESLRHIHKAGDHATINQLRLLSLLPDDLSKFWRYNGSLTTPFCFESVIWTVFAQPQKISKSQLEILRSLLHEEGHDMSDRGEHHSFTPSRLVDNWRPLQPLNGRVVKQSFRRDFMHNKPPLDTRFATFEASAPGLAIANRPDSLGGTVMYNINPTFQTMAPQETTKERAMPQANSKLQARITEINHMNSQQQFGRGAMGDKQLMYNQGPSVEMGMESSPFSVSSEKSQQVDASRDIGLADAPATTLFGQIQRSSQGLVDNNGPEFNMPQSEQYGHVTSPVVNIFSRPRFMSSSRKMTMGINTSTPSSHMLPNSQQQRGQSSAAVGRSQPLAARQQTLTQQNTSSVFRSNPRPGRIDSRLAALANNIRSHRNLGITQLQTANGNPQLPPVIRHNTLTPSAILNQPGDLISQRQQPNLLQQQRQAPHASRPPTPQQLRAIFEKLAALRRANARSRILTSGAATIPRFKLPQQNSVSGTRFLDSPALSGHPTGASNGSQQFHIPRDSNSPFLSPPSFPVYAEQQETRQQAYTQQQQQQEKANPQLQSQQQKIIPQQQQVEANPQLQQQEKANPQPPQQQQQQQQEEKANPQPPTPPQHQQQQEEKANPQQQQQQKANPQQQQQQQQKTNPHQQQQQPQQQQAYTQQQRLANLLYTPSAPTAMYHSPMVRAEMTNLYYTADPSLSGPGSNNISLPHGTAMDANAHQVYLTNNKQPVRILRPTYQQGGSRPQAQYQKQQFPFFVN